MPTTITHYLFSVILFFYPYIVELRASFSEQNSDTDGITRLLSILMSDEFVKLIILCRHFEEAAAKWHSNERCFEQVLRNILPSCNCTLYRLEEVSLIYWTLAKTLYNDFIKKQMDTTSAWILRSTKVLANIFILIEENV